MSLGDKQYGYEQSELRTFVQDKLAELKDERAERSRIERDERAAERAHALMVLEMKAKEKDSPESKVLACENKTKKMEVPKFDNTMDVATYLELFEAVMTQNQEDQTAWVLFLRASVLKSKLADAIGTEDFGNYAQVKSEMLVTYGTTPSSAWREMHEAKQGQETFRQYALRVGRLVKRWIGLVVESSATKEKVLEAIVRQLVLESADPELAAYLRRECEKDSKMEDFVEAGGNYQSSFEKASAKKPQVPAGRNYTQGKSAAKADSNPQSTMGCYSITAEEAERKLFALPAAERFDYVLKNRLRLNCLRKNHRATHCYSKGKCTKCNGKHHVLMHGLNMDSAIKSYACNTAAEVQLMTAVAEVKGQERCAKVRVFIDLGSQSSFVSGELVRAIKPRHLGTERVKVTAFDGPRQTSTMDRYEVHLTTASGRPVAVQALERPGFDLKLPPASADHVAYWSEQQIELADKPCSSVPSDIHMLIGADKANELLIERCVVDNQSVWKTELGWILSGPGEKVPKKEKTMAVGFVQSQVELLWQMEEPLPVEHGEDLPAFPIRQMEGKYEIGLLWKSDERPADNRAQAAGAVRKLYERLSVKKQAEKYEEVLMSEYGELEAIEREPCPETAGYYLPHHAVVREDSATTKTRVVFNASAAKKGQKSLNDTINPGPSLLPDLVGLLLRFREFQSAMQADIRKVFFMIAVREEDRKFLRFLWPDNTGKLTTWRLQKLPFGVNCSPYVLTSVLRHHLATEMQFAPDEITRVLKLLEKSLYVDDCITSLATAPEAIHFKKASSECLAKAGMELRKWRGTDFPSDDSAGKKVLGVLWDVDDDLLSVDVSNAVQPDWTKRNLLQTVASVYDPLGLVAPVVMSGKILLQKAWIEIGEWDSPLSPELSTRITLWLGELMRINEFAVSRWLGCMPNVPVCLHVFADASESAYGCCVYVVSEGEDTAHLVYAKAKVAPLKSPSLARLELQAACLAARRITFVISALRLTVSRVVGWSDSLTAICWIKGQSFRWKTWVRNRVVEIQELSEKNAIEWHHVPGVDNPADLVSRGAKVDDVAQSLWLSGPTWLPHQDQWPQQHPEEPVTAEAQGETRTLVNLVQATPAEAPWWTRLSKWTRVVGVVKCMLRWKYGTTMAGELQRRAEAALYRLVQAEVFPEDVAALKAVQKLPSKSTLSKFQPYLDDSGVMRVGGRIGSSDLPFEAKHPVLLSKHYLSEVLMRHFHLICKHQGVEYTLAVCRESVWLIGGRRMLRSVKAKCVTCRKFAAKCADEQSAPLPEDRVVFRRPYSLCGIDYAGPLAVKVASGTAKVWIALFVCGITRAVYLDLVFSLRTEEFLLAFRRFCARWGKPQRIRSDNATTFTAASKALAIDWVFNPPSAPWFGGFYERLVGVVKAPLKKVLGNALLRREELATMLCEVESCVNHRPLTHNGNEADAPPLTPAMLIGKNVWLSEDTIDESSLSTRQLDKRQKYLATVSQHLENRWRTKYLVALSNYHVGRSTPVKLNDVVLIADDNRRPMQWKLGRVLELYQGADGKRRVARLSIGGASTMIRPIRRLVPLEVASDVEMPLQATESPVLEPEETCQPQPTPLSPVVPRTSRGRAVRPRQVLDL